MGHQTRTCDAFSIIRSSLGLRQSCVGLCVGENICIMDNLVVIRFIIVAVSLHAVAQGREILFK